MTAPGTDHWFGSALSGSDGTADPAVRHRPDPVWSDPTADTPTRSATAGDPIVLPPVHLAVDRAQVERLLDEPVRPTPPPRPVPPRPVQPPRPIRQGPPPAQHVVRTPPPPPPHTSPWTSAGLSTQLNNFLGGQQPRPPARPPRQQAPKKANAAAGWLTFLIFLGVILLSTGAGEQLFHLIEELFQR